MQAGNLMQCVSAFRSVAETNRGERRANLSEGQLIQHSHVTCSSNGEPTQNQDSGLEVRPGDRYRRMAKMPVTISVIIQQMAQGFPLCSKFR